MKLNVMIVDDEVVSREYIKGLIDWEKEGYFLVCEAQSVKEAMLILDKHEVNIVLFDVFMPKENGVDLSKKIAQVHPSIAMIAISSYDNYDYVREILKNGAHDYILKHRLDSRILFQALKSASMHINMDIPVKKNNENKAKVEKWLQNEEVCPFSLKNGMIAISFAEVALENIANEQAKKAILNGIASIFEECSNSDQQITAVYYPQNHFVICTYITKTISEAKMHSLIYMNNIKATNNIKLVYRTNILISEAIRGVDSNLLRSYVQAYLSKVKVLANTTEQLKLPKINISVAQRKKLLTAVEERNCEAVTCFINEIYQIIPNTDIGSRILITKELLDILMNISAELKVEVDFILNGQELFEWAQNKSVENLVVRITGLYRQVIKEGTKISSFSEKINKVNKYIEGNYTKQINLEDAAKEINVTASYLSRLYRQETGMTFIDYLNKVRIDAAKGFMKNEIPLKEVAVKCGFKSYNYFFKVFKDYEGITPTEYLK